MKIIWTRTATNSLDEIVDYINTKFGKKIGLAFFNECISVVESIHQYNDIGTRLPENPVYRSFVIAKKTTLYYSIRSGDLYLLYFFNNRVDPEKLRKVLDL